MYQLELSRRANRDFQKLPIAEFERVAATLKQLKENPRPVGIKKLKSTIYRIRTGDWRIIYTISDKENSIVVLKIARRSEDTYNKLKELF